MTVSRRVATSATTAPARAPSSLWSYQSQTVKKTSAASATVATMAAATSV